MLSPVPDSLAPSLQPKVLRLSKRGQLLRRFHKYDPENPKIVKFPKCLTFKPKFQEIKWIRNCQLAEIIDFGNSWGALNQSIILVCTVGNIRRPIKDNIFYNFQKTGKCRELYSNFCSWSFILEFPEFSVESVRNSGALTIRPKISKFSKRGQMVGKFPGKSSRKSGNC